MKNTMKYVGLDVHPSTVSVAVLDAEGKLIQQSILATHAAAILDFVHGVRGSLQVTVRVSTNCDASFSSDFCIGNALQELDEVQPIIKIVATNRA